MTTEKQEVSASQDSAEEIASTVLAAQNESAPSFFFRLHRQVALHGILIRAEKLQEDELIRQNDRPHRWLIEGELRAADTELAVGDRGLE